MAATDKPHRDQNILDIVFAVSSILMLVSIVGMFMQDYFLEFKEEQRSFRDVETALAQRQALDQLPNLEQFDQAQNAVLEARAFRNPAELNKFIEDLKSEIAKAPADKKAALEAKLQLAERRIQINKEYPIAKARIAELMPQRDKNEQAYQSVKAVLDSISSFYDIEVDHNGPGTEKAKGYYQKIQELKGKVREAQAAKDAVMAELKDNQAKTDQYEGPLTQAISNWKKTTDKFDAQVKLVISKQWGLGDTIRAMPMLDEFNSPIKIKQFTINDIPIDYNFKYVTRFDRCMTCHQGIDRPNFSKDKLLDLVAVSSEYDDKLVNAHELMKRRKRDLEGLPEAKSLAYWKDLKLNKVSENELTKARVTEFCAHPRLELFVGSNSKHPAEKFGCTSCHSGQGSGTSFVYSSHTPNTSTAKERWVKDHGYEAIHDWDFPMYPVRFVESSCLKCHHQVTDLIGSDNRNEAPKLVRGYNLIKENGCFGCHEIAGRKGGRQIGPDLRLEPTPPLESLTPNERAKIEADPDTSPGNLRKVGPSLYRLSEKTNREFVAKWIRSPRDYRPDTKMPHFYGLSNNDPGVHPEWTDAQKKFPDTEIRAITHYLFEASNGYLKDIAARHELMAALAKGKLTEQQARELADVDARLHLRGTELLVDQAPGYNGDAGKGRVLFSTKGCLACHSHEATETSQKKSDKEPYAPAMKSQANFGPNLSKIVDKLVANPEDKKSARKWLIQWIMNPSMHSPRTRMPDTHMTNKEAADVAAWLLAQAPKSEDEAEEKRWADLNVAEPTIDDLKKLAEVYLVRLLSRSSMEEFLKNGKLGEEALADLPAEEKELVQHYKANMDGSLKYYLGRKAVSRYGCFACHDIPGFDTAKSIGVALNDWGKKDPKRLAFEDIDKFLDEHYQVVPSLVGKNGKPVQADKNGGHGHGDGKMPYEKFYADALVHEQRDGYLNQKILDPRSYDYNRLRAWDDLSRMPQFRFARSRKKDKETEAEYEARKIVEEAEAREAVATFILGLVADPVPTASINQPKGDRLAEVKGRQVLEKYNCAGCHLIRPGYFDIKVNDGTLAKLDEAYKGSVSRSKEAGEHFFLNHADWVGKNPTSPDRLFALAVRPKFKISDPDDPDSKTGEIEFQLTRALRFQDADKKMKDIISFTPITLKPADMVYPPKAAWDSRESLAAFVKDKGPYGGAFADLLVPYLVSEDKKNASPFFTMDPDGDSSRARAAVPPILLGQGERTQPKWLYQFLLNPEPIRKMVVLRMPKFNMSPDEAQTLVNYFSAVERIENTGIGLKYPYDEIQQQEPLTDAFWLRKNKEYIDRLKATGQFDKRVEELKPIWQQVKNDLETKQADAKIKATIAKERMDKADKARTAETDKVKKEPLEAAFKTEDDFYKKWKSETDLLTEQLKKSSLEEQRKIWETEQAVLTDGFRLLANRTICMQCHQVDKTPIDNQTQGPPLYLAHERLRPGWVERWVATPQRFLTYKSSMIVNFPSDKKGQNQDFFAGTPLEQVIGVRDLLMAYPRAMALPINHYWTLPMLGDTKK